MASRKLRGSTCTELLMLPEEQQAKISEVRKIMGPIADKLPVLCSDASILRYLRARNSNTKKAAKMLKDSLKWRLEYKPEKIQWEDVAHEAETGKVYKANYLDKTGRTVIVLRPGFQNTSTVGGQIKHLVYCMENAILTSNPDQEQMVWLIDFQGWTMATISLKAARETANVLQNHYPERLGIAILYNPPKVFESFWTMVKPFLEPKTHKKVRFAYSNDLQSKKIMEELFDMDKLELAFGGRNSTAFNIQAYAQRMKDEDKKRSDSISYGFSSPTPSITTDSQCSGLSTPSACEVSDEDDSSSGEEKVSNLDIADDRRHGVLLSCKDIATADAAAEVVKELKTSQLV